MKPMVHIACKAMILLMTAQAEALQAPACAE